MFLIVLNILKLRDSVYGSIRGLYKLQCYVGILFRLKFNARECMSYFANCGMFVT